MSQPNEQKIIYDFDQLYALIKKTQKYRTSTRAASPTQQPKLIKPYPLLKTKIPQNKAQFPKIKLHKKTSVHPSKVVSTVNEKGKSKTGKKSLQVCSLSNSKLYLEDSIFNFSSFCSKPNGVDSIRPLTESISNKSILLVSTTNKEASANKIVFNVETAFSTLNKVSNGKEFKTFHINNGATSNNSYASEQTTPSRHKFSMNKSRDSPAINYTRLNIPLPSKLNTIYYKYLEKLRYGNNAKQLKKNTGDEATILPEDIE